jgi:hypothetical protein
MNKKRINPKGQFFHMNKKEKLKGKNKAPTQRKQVGYLGKVTFNKLKWDRGEEREGIVTPVTQQPPHPHSY